MHVQRPVVMLEGAEAMLIIGERINTSRKGLDEKVANRDEAFFRELARKQFEAGAAYLDVNCGTRINTEADDIVAVPGKVLAAGSLTHPVTVAAYSFSEGAREKISLAEGHAVSLTELMDEGIDPSNIRILK